MKNKSIYNTIIIGIIICIAHIIITKSFDFEFIFIIGLIVIAYIKLYPKEKIKASYRQQEILMPLINSLDIKKTLPESNALDGFAANPDFLCLLHELIKKNKPKIIIEAGAGVSTLICGYSLKQFSPDGKVFSLDHDDKFSTIIVDAIEDHNLNNYAQVISAPLVQHSNKNFQWYDINKISNVQDIDMLIIDGPPANSSKNARYPAIPLMIEKLKKGSIIILDDANRKYEKQILNLWKKEYDCFDYNYIANSKGACIIKKIK